MAVYEQITYKPEGATRSKTIILQNPTIDEKIISGEQVGKDGNLKDTIHIISTDLVNKRRGMVMNNHYGALEFLPSTTY